MFKTYVKGTGSYLPENKLTNKDFEKSIETSDEWIFSRTGISSRNIAGKDQTTSDLAYEAAVKAMAMAQVEPHDIDFIFVATTSPDYVMPNTACILQSKLGIPTSCGALDVAAACTGFIYSISIADQMIKTGAYKNILVVGAEILSRFVDYKDRKTCILFGDAAGAAIVSSAPENSPSEILNHKLGANGTHGDILHILAGGSKNPTTPHTLEKGMHFIRMNGREVFKNAVRDMSESCEFVLKKAQVDPSEVDWVVPHQANTRILESLIKHFDFNADKVIFNIEHMGNTSAASVPVTFDVAVRDQRIQRGDLVLMTAFGGGLTCGSMLLRF